MTTAVKTQKLNKNFGDKKAVIDLNLEIQAGEIIAFLGPNGAGKTTTIRLLNGVLKPTIGSGQVLGYDIKQDSIELQSKSGVVTETLTLYERFSGRYNLEFYGNLYGLDFDLIKKRINELASFLELEEFLDRRVETYSTGMKKKLSLARALVHDPEILFLDEPTTGLDPEAAQKVIDYIAQLNLEQNKTIFLCTHNLEVAETLATRIMLIDKGKLKASGSPAQLRQELWPEIELEIECKDWEQVAKKKMQQVDWINKFTTKKLTSELTKIVIELKGRDYIPSMVNWLVGQNCRLFSVVEREYSFEDIYFKLQEEDGDEF